MKLTIMKLTGLWACIVLTFCSFGVYAAESHLAQGHVIIAENQEAPVNKDQVEGRVEEVKGKVKEATGVLLDDKGMEIEGNIQKNVGKIQSGYGDLKQDIKKE
ncbi:CsbD family protein [Methylomonas lenta]|uniref:CsbD family protein n=1 Tax=Methylomonas lenta TaxID=980561 RepID=UPI000A9BA87E|nr:CsbD family protein [Methylomonas lenta]